MTMPRPVVAISEKAPSDFEAMSMNAAPMLRPKRLPNGIERTSAEIRPARKELTFPMGNRPE